MGKKEGAQKVLLLFLRDAIKKNVAHKIGHLADFFGMKFWGHKSENNGDSCGD